MRHPRPLQRRQVDGVQRVDRDRGGAGVELSVQHHRAERGRGDGARSAPRRAGKAREVRQDQAHAAHLRGYRGPGERRLQGEGLGNQFLAHVREVDAIAHVVRCFVDPDVAHVAGAIDPIADIETIETELMLADLDSLERRVDGLAKKAKGTDNDASEARETLDLVNRALGLLRAGKPARLVERKPEEEKAFRMLGLLTSVPVLYVCNVDEAAAAIGNDFSRRVEARAREEGAACVIISAKIEAEIAVLPAHERDEYLAAIG